jgi:hypothetical protein
MADNRKNALIALLVAAGLFGAQNAAQYVETLEVSQAEELINTLSHPNLSSAIFVAAATISADKTMNSDPSENA